MSEKKAALITGGSRGIGRATSLRLAREGYHVLINYRDNTKEAENTLKLATEAGGSGELCPFDITDRPLTSKTLEQLTEKHRIQVLVFCAGIRNDELLIFMSEDQWDSVLATNLSSFHTVAKPVVRHMMLNRTGRIIVISSTSGESGLAGQVNYSAAKAGLIGAVKALARECAKRNVLVNAVTPGLIATDMTENVNEQKLLQNVPLNRPGTPEEVAAAVAFFASDEASYITGQVIGVNGGVYM